MVRPAQNRWGLIGLVFILLSIAHPLSAQAQVMASMDLEDIDPTSQDVHIEKGKANTVGYSAAVTVDKAPVGTMTVQLGGACNTGWPVIVVPSVIDFQRSGREFVTITVTIPDDAEADTMGMMTVTAVATWPGGSQSDTSGASIHIMPRYQAKLSVGPMVGVNNPETFKVNITNFGNLKDQFKVSILEKQDLEKRGFRIEFSRSKTREIDMGEEDELEFEVSYGPTSVTGRQHLTVEAKSMASVEANNETITTVAVIIDVAHGPGGGYGWAIVVTSTIIIIVVVVGVAFYLMRRRSKRAALSRSSSQEEAEKKED